MIIDFSAHYVPASVIRRWEKTKAGPGKNFIYSDKNADAEFRLGLMEKYGVDMQAISLSAPALLPHDRDVVPDICRLSNERTMHSARPTLRSSSTSASSPCSI